MKNVAGHFYPLILTGMLKDLFLFKILERSTEERILKIHHRYVNKNEIYNLSITAISGAGIAQLVVFGLAAKVSRIRYSSGDIFR